MVIVIILLMFVVFFLYVAPYFSPELHTVPFISQIIKLKNTIMFGLIGLIFAVNADPFQVTNVFMGMIAGSFIDLNIKNKE